jgi:hypothetical protein
MRTAEKTDTRLAARLAALASLGASVIHFAVAPVHWTDWAPAGLVLFAVALFRLVWAWAILTRPTTPLVALGVVGNVATIAVWAVTRTLGSPVGPHSGVPEVVQAGDLCAVLLEIYVVLAASWMGYRGRVSQPIPAVANAVILFGFGTVIASAAMAGAASGLAD